MTINWALPTAAEEWKQVAARFPNQPAAHLRLAQAAAKQGQWKQAEREFILAETYFNAIGDTDMVRAVSARRGFARIESGDLDQARADLPALFSLPSRLPNAGYGPCERTVTLMAGQDDNFALPFDPVPYVNPDFAGINEYNFQKHLKQFDEQLSGAYVFASLVLPPLTFCDGRLGIHMRKGKPAAKPTGSRTESRPSGRLCPVRAASSFGPTGQTKTRLCLRP